MTKYERLRNRAVSLTMLIFALEEEIHIRKNRMASAEEIRHDDMIEELDREITSLTAMGSRLSEKLESVGFAMADY